MNPSPEVPHCAIDAPAVGKNPIPEKNPESGVCASGIVGIEVVIGELVNVLEGAKIVVSLYINVGEGLGLMTTIWVAFFIVAGTEVVKVFTNVIGVDVAAAEL